MRREFSKELEEDREFEIGGQVFRFVYPHWKDGAKLFDDEMVAVQEAADGNGDSNAAFSFVADTETAIKRVPMFLDEWNDSHKRWKDLTARKEAPVPRHQIAQLYRWLVEVTSGFPTTPQSPSTSGDTSNGDSSPAGES